MLETGWDDGQRGSEEAKTRMWACLSAGRSGVPTPPACVIVSVGDKAQSHWSYLALCNIGSIIEGSSTATASSARSSTERQDGRPCCILHFDSLQSHNGARASKELRTLVEDKTKARCTISTYTVLRATAIQATGVCCGLFGSLFAIALDLAGAVRSSDLPSQGNAIESGRLAALVGAVCTQANATELRAALAEARSSGSMGPLLACVAEIRAASKENEADEAKAEEAEAKKTQEEAEKKAKEAAGKGEEADKKANEAKQAEAKEAQEEADKKAKEAKQAEAKKAQEEAEKKAKEAAARRRRRRSRQPRGRRRRTRKRPRRRRPRRRQRRRRTRRSRPRRRRPRRRQRRRRRRQQRRRRQTRRQNEAKQAEAKGKGGEGEAGSSEEGGEGQEGRRQEGKGSSEEAGD